jgi:hypothetical protein
LFADGFTLSACFAKRAALSGLRRVRLIRV